MEWKKGNNNIEKSKLIPKEIIREINIGGCIMGFTLVFWGLLIGLVGDVIQQQTYVIGFVATLVLFIGLRKLSLFNACFFYAKKYLIVSFLWSACTIIAYDLLQELLANHWRITNSVISLVGGLLNLLVIYYLCKGILEMAKEYDKPEIATIAQERWNYYLYFNVISIVISMNVFLIPGLGIFMLVMSVLINLLLTGLFYQAQKAFRFLRPPTSVTHRLT